VKEIEEEAEKIRQMQTDVEKQMNMSSASSVGMNLYLWDNMVYI
jgi:hypothetical protein